MCSYVIFECEFHVCARLEIVKVSLGLMNNLAVKKYKEVKVLLNAFLTLAVVGGEWLASLLWSFYPKGRALVPIL